MQCALHRKHGAKCSAYHLVYAIWTVVPCIYNALTASHMQDSIFSWTYLRRYWRYIGNWMCVILQTWCQIQRTFFSFAIWTVVPDIYNVNTLSHILASIFEWTYLRCYSRYIDNSMWIILRTWCQIQRTSSSLRYLNCGPGHMQCTYSSTYSGFIIQLKESPTLLEIYRQNNVRYTANMVPNTAHILQFTPCELWSRTYTM
jgi:hypothetical protein